MEPTVCSRCGKNIAVLFITKIENGETKNEGLCLKCARELHIKPVDDVIARLGLSEDDLDSLTHDMSSLMSGMPEELGADLFGAEDGGDEDEGKTATFPFLSRLMGAQNMGGNIVPSDNHKSENKNDNNRPGAKENRSTKRKFLDTYCINLTDRAREGKLDAMIGRQDELERVIQILNRRQKNNPCLIGEPGVGKTAIAEGLAQRIAKGEVPYKLKEKEVHLLDLTALVAGTQFRGQFESRMKGLIQEITK
ncbi:MAG: ATP-dependent Clp protease ATP-binding subunit, partial [Oscillospiraceae bacterium]|nr:ATP-dependent Clp protease ATP-binding subunit [Oscillospiraceae bacterium]